jgi:osmotically-inducible protein OsmY
MKRDFAMLLVIAGLAAAPFSVYSADTSTETTKEKAVKAEKEVKRVSKDSTITTKIKAKYAEDHDVSALKIHVKTKSGVVTLTGKAKTDAEKSKAEDLAKEIEGVKSVTNKIKVAAAK